MGYFYFFNEKMSDLMFFNLKKMGYFNFFNEKTLDWREEEKWKEVTHAKFIGWDIRKFFLNWNFLLDLHKWSHILKICDDGIWMWHVELKRSVFKKYESVY
jgi:hypothetical protein